MKKFFLFAAAVIAAMTVNAQEPNILVVQEYCNYVHFQSVTSETPVPTSLEDTWYVFENGTVCKGFKKSDETEAANSWNIKGSPTANSFPMPEEASIDSVKWGSVFRAASGSSIELGAFKLNADGAVEVFYQPNGTSERGISITYDEPLEFLRAQSDKNVAYKVVYPLSAGQYDAGDIVIKVLTSTINIAGINIVGLQSQGVENVFESAKAVKTFENGQLVIIKNGVRYNALGVKF